MSEEKSGCLFVLLHMLGLMPKPQSQELPYRVRDDFLSPAERTFYAALVTALADQAVVCPKVRIGDVLFAPGTAWKHTNRINQKHVDFLVCSRDTMRPLFAVELDDSSHQREAARERDEFKDAAFKAARLPLVRFQAKRTYDGPEIASVLRPFLKNSVAPLAVSFLDPKNRQPVCPKCGVAMVKRTASRGQQAGKPFYGCQNFPKCREKVDSA